MRLFRRKNQEAREQQHLWRALSRCASGIVVAPEIGLPEGFEAPSASLCPLKSRAPSSTTPSMR